MILAASLALSGIALPQIAFAQRCDIPRDAARIWRCQNGLVIGPENVIIRVAVTESNPEALYRAGIEAAGNENWQLAIAYFTLAHQRAHLVPRYMYNLGLAHARAGNDVPAAAWLAAYLVADPAAPNRAEVSALIRSSERLARTKIDRLWQGVEEAAAQLPVFSGGQWWNGRGGAYLWGARAAARSGDWGRASHFLDLVMRSDHVPQSDRSYFERFIRAETHRDGSSAIAAAIVDGVQLDENLRQGISETAVADTRRFFTPYFGSFAWEWPAHWNALSPHLVALREGRPPSGADNFGGIFQLAASGRGREALRLIAPVSNPRPVPDEEEGFVGNLRAEKAAQIGEIALLSGDVSTARTAHQLSLQFARASAGDQATTSEFWAPARLNALILAEAGETDTAIQQLHLFISTHGYGSRDHHETPYRTRSASHRWSEMRHYPAGTIADYLVWRGRIGDALAVADQLDTVRRMLFLDSLLARVREGRSQYDADEIAARRAAAFNSAAGGEQVIAAHAERIRDMLQVTRNVTGAAHDLNSWLNHVRSLDDASQQLEGFSHAAETLARGLRRVRRAYVNAGGSWPE